MDKYYCWACDFSNKTGEGNLARLFIKKNILQRNYKIFTINNIKILGYKYFSPLIGILFCWYLFIKRKKVAYLNYLPLWNCSLFIFLPPGTIFGPITGGAYYKKQILLRKFCFPIAYKISEFFLNLRNVKIYFSTELLKKYLTKSTIRKSNFNFILNNYQQKKICKKEIDFLIYYRIHKNKEDFFPYDLIKKLISLNFEIHIVGDYLKNSSVFNHGYIDNNKIQKLLSKTFFSITSNENPYGLFAIECFNNNVKLIIQKSEIKKITYFKEKFIFTNYNSIYSLKNLKYYK
jgi:hypothetical protein